MSERKEPLEEWVVVVVPEGDGAPAAVRVKRWLKAGKRGFGLRCVLVRDPTQEEVEQVREGES